MTASKRSPTVTPRKARFVAEYQIDQNATQAAIRAGYSERTAKQQGSRLLTDVDVVNMLVNTHATAAQVVEEKLSEAIGSAAWIVEKAAAVVRMAFEQERPGIATPALALLAKMHPEFSEKHEVTGDVRLRVEALAAVAQMTPDELRTLAERARA